MAAKSDAPDGRKGTGQQSRWAFAALLAGNMVLALGAPLVRLADTGPIASGFWRMTIALPALAWLAWRETGGRMPSRTAIGVATAAGVFFALDLAAWHLGILGTATLPILLSAAIALGEVIVPWNGGPLIALALSSQIIGQGLMIWALPRFSPLVVGLTLLVQPAIAALAGWMIFGERLTAIDLVGGSMIGAALVLIRLPNRAAQPI